MRNPSSSQSKQGAFTLLEVMLVIICLAAITAMASQAINTSMTKSQTTAQEALLQQIAVAKARFVLDNHDNQSRIDWYNQLSAPGGDHFWAFNDCIMPYMTQRGETPRYDGATDAGNRYLSIQRLLKGTGKTHVYANSIGQAPSFDVQH